jgi:hypothetical protein
MRNERLKAIPIRRDIIVLRADQEVVDFAYNLWLARDFRGGSPEEDLLNAFREVRGRGLFLVPKRNLIQCDIRPLPVRRGVTQEAGHNADIAFAGRRTSGY